MVLQRGRGIGGWLAPCKAVAVSTISRANLGIPGLRILAAIVLCLASLLLVRIGLGSMMKLAINANVPAPAPVMPEGRMTSICGRAILVVGPLKPGYKFLSANETRRPVA